MAESSLEERVEGLSDTDIQRSLHLRRRRRLFALATGMIAGGATYVYSENSFASCFHGFLGYVFVENLFYSPFALHQIFSLRGFYRGMQGMYVAFQEFLSGKKPEVAEDQYRARKLKFLEYIHTSTKDPVVRFIVSISIAQISNALDTALRRSITLFELYQRHGRRPSLFERFRSGLDSFIFNKTPQRLSPKMQLSAALYHLRLGMRHHARQDVASAVACAGPQHIPLQCLEAYFCHHLFPDEAPAQWQKTIDLLLHDPASQSTFRRLGVSKHEVLEISGGILHDAFVFKRNPQRDGLYREYSLNLLQSKLLTEKVRVPESLHFTSVNDRYYLAMRRAHGVVFPDVDLHDREKKLHAFFPALAGYHATLDHAHTSFDSLLREKNYARALTKIVQRLGRSVPEQTVSAYSTLLEQQPRSIIHGDFHPNNVLASEQDYTILDPEYMMQASVHLDLAAFLEHDALHLERGQIHTFLQNYYDAQDSRRGSFDTFLHDYYPAALLRMLQVQSALTASSYGMNEETRASTKDYYRQRGRELLSLFSEMDQHQAEPLRPLENLLTEMSA